MTEEPRQQTILIVDSERANVQMLRNLLRDHYELALGLSGADALLCARGQTPPDLILLEIHLPDMDGSLCLNIAKRKRWENELRRRNREIEAINLASQALNSTLELDQVLETLLEEVRHLMGVVGTSIGLADPETGKLVCRQAAGTHSRAPGAQAQGSGRQYLGQEPSCSGPET